ncbi:MAG: hypothetical protein P8N09_06500 [Planctomycetota bacterium]|nr:hypothetical protein [Planctomycetota bacterium]
MELISLSSVGLAFDIVGVIFLANSMGVRNPRRFIQEHFGIVRQQPLRAVHQQVRVKAQIFTGFLFLMVGFSLQIGAQLFPLSTPPVRAEGFPLQAIALLLGGIIVTTILLRMAQNTWSLTVFRRLLTEFFQEHSDWNFEKHPEETREIGEILGISSKGDDSIADYAERVRAALKLTPESRRRASTDDAFAPLRKLGAGRRQ